MQHIYSILDAIRESDTPKPAYWQTVLDYALDEATDDERWLMTDLISNDDALYNASTGIQLPSNATPDQLIQFLKHTLAFIALRNGAPDPCAIPDTVARLRSFAQMKGIANFDSILHEVAQIGAPRIRQTMLSDTVDLRLFGDYAIVSCEELSPALIQTIEDPQVRSHFQMLKRVTGNYHGWATLADFYRQGASPVQRKMIIGFIQQADLASIESKVDKQLQEKNPKRYVELYLMMVALTDAVDSEANKKVEKLDRRHARHVNVRRLRREIAEISPPNAKKAIEPQGCFSALFGG